MSVCVYTGTRPWKNVSLLWLCLFFMKVTNLRLTLNCSNDPFLFGDSTSQLKGIPAETSRRRAETHAWIFNRLFCCIPERPRKMKALCPSGIGTLRREREALLPVQSEQPSQTRSMSFDRRSMDVPVAWQRRLTDVAPRLKWSGTIGLLSRCLAIINKYLFFVRCPFFWGYSDCKSICFTPVIKASAAPTAAPHRSNQM